MLLVLFAYRSYRRLNLNSTLRGWGMWCHSIMWFVYKMKCKVIVITITATYCYHYFSMYRWILSVLITCVVNLRSGEIWRFGVHESGVHEARVLEVMQALEGILEDGGVSRVRLSFGCFSGSLSFWCDYFYMTSLSLFSYWSATL